MVKEISWSMKKQKKHMFLLLIGHCLIFPDTVALANEMNRYGLRITSTIRISYKYY